MAILHGESGAWTGVKQFLRARSLEVAQLGDIETLLHATKKQREQGLEPHSLAFDSEQQQFAERVQKLREQLVPNILLHTRQQFARIEQINQALAAYHACSVLWKLLTFGIPAARLQRQKKEQERQKDEHVSRLRQYVADQQKEYDARQSQRDTLVQQRYHQLEADIGFLENTLRSQELAGATAELELIRCLKRLPDSYHVLNDVTLRAHRKIRFDSDYLQSAQIDHLVVGPSGVYVIEVKRWSRQFVEQQNYFDPYKQVRRASYLCYDTVRRFFPGINVRSVIVSFGALPPCPKTFAAKCLRSRNCLGT